VGAWKSGKDQQNGLELSLAAEKHVEELAKEEPQVLELLLVVSVHGNHLGESLYEVDDRRMEKRSIGDISSKLQNENVHTS